MEQADLRDCINDPQYRSLGPKTCDRLGFKPHYAIFSQKHNRIVVFLKKGAGADYSISTDMVKALCAMQTEKKIAQAYIAQRDGNEVVDWETAYNVARKINGVTPRQGDWGPYVWVEENTFNVVGGNAAWPDEELPF